MATNMNVLWNFSSSIVNIPGQVQFTAMYLSAGINFNCVSYVCKVDTGRYGPSLGTLGAIMTIFAAICTKIPEGRITITFLSMFTFTAGNVLKANIARDTIGMILGWKFLIMQHILRKLSLKNGILLMVMNLFGRTGNLL